MRKDCIHITHNDSDAIGCALVAALYYPEYDLLKNTVFCSATGGSDTINQILDDYVLNGKEFPSLILISDISLTEETCRRLDKIKVLNPNIILAGYDHHPTNLLDKNFSWFKVIRHPIHDVELNADVNISAAKFMLSEIVKRLSITDYSTAFFPKLNEIIGMISRYDTWVWKNYTIEQLYPFKDDIVQVICRAYGPYETFRDLLSMYEDYRIHGCYRNSPVVPSLFENIYRVEKNNEYRYIKNIDDNVRCLNYGGYNCAIFFNDGNYSNAACDYLYSSYQKIDIIIVLYPSKCQIGLRTSKENIDLGEIAKSYYGGGGHKKASGAILKPEEFLKLLNMYYMNSVPLRDFIKED